MAFEERVGGAEFGEDVAIGHWVGDWVVHHLGIGH